jgi:hypothetical protein
MVNPLVHLLLTIVSMIKLVMIFRLTWLKMGMGSPLGKTVGE